MKHHFVRRWISAALSGVLTVLLLAVPFSGAVPKASENWKSLLSAEPITAQAAGDFRRPVSNTQPMWIVHIDSCNYAHPAKIIDLIPEDVLALCGIQHLPLHQLGQHQSQMANGVGRLCVCKIVAAHLCG